LSDQIVLRIRATTGHIGLARATASALAARLDFTYDRLMDLHIAMDEACGRVLATSDPPARNLQIVFEPDADGIRISVRGDGRLKPDAQFLNPWSKVILESIVQNLEVSEHGENAVGLSFRIARGNPS